MLNEVKSALGGKAKPLFTALFLALAFCNVRNTNAQPGSLDSTFSADGKVTTDFGLTAGQIGYSAAIQSDGKILVAGYSYNFVSSNYDFALVRYNSDGTLDNTFNSNGIVVTAIGSGDDNGYAVAIQSDGKIVVGGKSLIGADNDFALARYNAVGTLDNTFNADGKVTTDFSGSDDVGTSIVIQSDGKIVVAGYTDFLNDYDFTVVRYNSDGTVDATFSNATVDFGSGDDYGYAVRLQADGKIVVAGTSYISGDDDFAVARYNSDGTLDTTFSADGKETTDFPGLSSNEKGYSVTIQTDGKIVVAGYGYNGTDFDFALARYNSDGTLDNTFGTGGKVTTDFGGGDNDYGNLVSLQANDKIVVAGSSYNGVNYNFALARYNSDGTMDNTFGTGGKVTTDFAGSDDAGYSIALQSDGKIVVAGYSYNGSDLDFAAARYNGDAVTGMEEASSGPEYSGAVEIYPNPFSASATLVIATPSTRGKQSQSYTFTMYDLLGREMKLIEITGNKVEINRGNLPSGMYFYKLTDKQKILATGKIIIE